MNLRHILVTDDEIYRGVLLDDDFFFGGNVRKKFDTISRNDSQLNICGVVWTLHQLVRWEYVRRSVLNWIDMTTRLTLFSILSNTNQLFLSEFQIFVFLKYQVLFCNLLLIIFVWCNFDFRLCIILLCCCLFIKRISSFFFLYDYCDINAIIKIVLLLGIHSHRFDQRIVSLNF